ncbi:MAG: aspartate/glutamate racemase family protein [Rhodobacteraceae bacterium]|nr:aspartate/glutamate racemase family protein [Paracoccaceae bacterium]
MSARVLLINPNGNHATTQTMVAIAAAACADLTVQGATMHGQANVITTPQALQRAALAVAAHRVSPNVAAVIVAAFGDPGRDALRGRLVCPVVGIAEAGMLAAATGGRRFSVATTTPALEDPIRARAAAYGLADALVSVRVTAGDPLAVMGNPVRLRDAMGAAVARCAADGADAVVIGGGPLALVARDLSDDSPVPLIEPVSEAALHVARLVAHASVS